MIDGVPIGTPRIDILGCEVDDVDLDGAAARIREFLVTHRPAQVVTLGVEMVMLAQRDASYREVINGADLVVPDTVGIVWASRRLGRPLHERVAGIDLAADVIDSTDVPVYLLGAAEGVAARAAEALKARHHHLEVAGTHHGYFTADQSASVTDEIRVSGAKIVFVALGFPRQEFWIHENLARLGPVVCIGVGGAFDVWAGKVKRAPDAMRRAGLEWLYRLLTEPRRLARQLALPAFALKVLADGRSRDRRSI